jgi:phage/plasmid-associated DNA primase
MKTITGGGTINARNLYSDECNFKPVCSIILECNNLPLLDEINSAVIQRIRASLFETTFYTKDEFEKLSEEEKETAIMANPYYKTDEFHQKYKCALFDILIKYFDKFQQNNYQLSPMPKDCVKKCRDYFAVSDDIFSWFSEVFEKDDSIDSEPITLTDVYNKFKDSEYFMNLNKSDKRTYNRKNFTDKLEECILEEIDQVQERDSQWNPTK